jgi:NADPH-dependent glutamate synthase beta subunit-like oxidoreductase/CO/xanthine dehydrogenase FAD-binding subunit
MKRFTHVDTLTVGEAVSILRKYKGTAKVIAGGTDLLGQMKDNILPEYPEVIVNIKTISGLDYIREEGQTLRIGALTRLEDIAKDRTVKDKYAIVAEAARRTASPHIREMGTIGGNICQSTRCWYYWVPDNRFNCMRKGGKVCYAMTGDGRYHSIFGAARVVSTRCSSDCLAGVDIPSYLSKVRDGDLDEAAKILLNFNPLPSITGRVCPHFCESNCNRGEFDEPISVRSIERFMGDYILENATRLIKGPEIETEKSVAIVGSGPAGLSAAYYLRTFGYRVTVFDKMEEPGGLLTYGIPPYRLPKAIVRRQVKALEGTGIKFKLGVNIGKDTMEELMKSFDAVFLACGAWRERPAGVKGEKLITSGLEFLRNSNLGIREVPGKKAAVIGGGNVAIDVARTLLRMGAEPVVVYRRSEAEMPAVREEVKKAKEESIKFEFLTQPVEASEQDNKIALKCVRMRLGPLDETGRPRPVPIKGTEFTTEFDAVIKAIGEEPDTSNIPAEFLNKKGRLKIELSTHLLGKNVFAGGDFVTGPSTVVAAIAAGRKAASSIDRYLRDGGEQVEEKDKETGKLAERFNSSYLKKMSRVKTPQLSIAERIKSIDVEDVLGLDLSEVEMEANRCFNCGCVAVNSSDLAPALIALNAKIKTTKRVIEAEKFFAAEVEKTTILADGELVTEIQVPTPNPGTESSFIKFALRKSIDFPIVNCAAAIESEGRVVKGARICLNAVYNNPYRLTKAEGCIIGRSIDESTAEAAANTAITGVCPLATNRYKVQIAKALVKRAILACSKKKRQSRQQRGPN